MLKRAAQIGASSIAVAVLLVAALPGPLLAERPEIPEDLGREFREWLEVVSLLISEDELEYFLSLEEDFRRGAFIDKFWEVRDPDPRTPYNEFKNRWMSRVRQALEDWGSLEDARSRFYLLNGEPGRFVIGNGRVVDICYSARTELEIWFYGGSERTGLHFAVIFYRPVSRREWPYQIWLNDRDLEPALRPRLPSSDPSEFCDGDLFGGALQMIRSEPGYFAFIQHLMEVPKPRSEEWIASFAASTTDLPEDADTFEIGLEFDFPGRNQSRTAVQGLVSVPADGAGTRPGGGVHEFLLVGEVIRGDRLFESFRYRFEMPRSPDRLRLPLIFQRFLREGEVEVRVKVEDIYGDRFAHARRQLEVPDASGLRSVRQAPDAAIFQLLEEANEAAERGQTTIRLVPPEEGEIQLGHVRFNTVVSGEVERVAFLLNGQEIMTKREPPFSLELNLGATAASHRVRVVAYDQAGRERASDELLVNQGGQRFRVRLVEPRADREYLESLSAVVRVEVPDGSTLERVEIFLGEERVATLYQEPFVQPIILREPGGLAYVRAVGYLEDGNTTEDVVFVNAPEYFERVEVQLVELYATVLGRGGRLLLDLPKTAFTVLEDGVEQEIRRFEHVRDLPIHAGLLIDTSASMEEGLDRVNEAALAFVDQTIEARDRLALISFDVRPTVEVRFSNDREEIAAALEGLRATGSTALYDSLIFALHYFDGIKGQKALMLLSDGVDEASRFGFENALETARRAGVTVYVIGMKELAADKRSRETLRDLAEVTGGRAFFIDDLAELPEIYDRIQRELRSQYLLVYQSASDKDESEFRRIQVKVKGGAEVRTVAGYYP